MEVAPPHTHAGHPGVQVGRLPMPRRMDDYMLSFLPSPCQSFSRMLLLESWRVGEMIDDIAHACLLKRQNALSAFSKPNRHAKNIIIILFIIRKMAASKR